MAISLVGQESTDGTSVAIPTHQAGDLLLFAAFRDGSNSTPTKPGDITQLETNTTNSAGALTGYKLAASSSETSGTWSNATEVSVMVFRGVDQTNPVGDSVPATGNSTTISFPALSMAVGDGTSWVAGMAYHRSTDCDLAVTPSGMTLRLNEQNGADEVGLYDTNGGVSSWSLQTTSVGGSSSGWFANTVEIRAAAGGTTHTSNLTGALSFSGAIIKRDNRTLPGTLSFAGAITRTVYYPLTGSLSFIGTVRKTITKTAHTAALSFSGALASTKVSLKSLTGVLSFLVDSAGGYATPTLVQTKGNGGFGTSFAVTMDSNITSGSRIIVFIASASSGSFSSFSDDQGNTYTNFISLTPGFGPGIIRGYIANSPATSAPTITYTTNTSTSIVIIAREYAGLDVSSFDVSQNNTQTSGTSRTSNATASTAQSDELVVGFFANSLTSGSFSAGAGYGNLVNQLGTSITSAMEDKNVTSVGAQTATATVSSSSQGTSVVATFKAAAVTGQRGFTKKTIRGLSGVLSFAGAFLKLASPVLSGVLSFAGTLISTFIPGGTLYDKALSATLGFSGAITKQTNRSVTGSLSFSSTLLRAIQHGLTATLSFAGSLAKRFSHTFTGTLMLHSIGSLSLSGTSGNYASAPDSTALDISSDIDIRIRVAPADWNAGTVQTLVSKYSTVSNQRSFVLVLAANNAPQLGISSDGTTTNQVFATSTAAPNFSPNTINWIRVTWIQSTGVVQFFTAANSDNVPTSWTQLGTNRSIALSGIFNSNSPLEIGSNTGGTTSMMKGRFYRVQILSGVGGTVAFDADFTNKTSAITSFTESSSNTATVSLNGTGAVITANGFIKRLNRSITGNLSLNGSIMRQISHNLSGALGFSGTLSRAAARQLMASISFAGSVIKQTAKIITSTVGFNIPFHGNGVITVSDSSDFSWATNTGLTVAVKIRPDELTFGDEEGSGYVHFLTKLDTNQNEWTFRIYGQDNADQPWRGNRISFYVYSLNGLPLGDGVALQDTVVPGEWIYLVATIDSSKTMKLYKNGTLRDTFTSSLTLQDGIAPIRFGSGAQNANPANRSYFYGALDQIRIWDRPLTSIEITNLIAGTVPASGLKGEWLLGNGDDLNTTAYDSSGNSHHGAISNVDWVQPNNLIRKVNRLLTSSLGFTGLFGRTTLRTLTGSMNFIGTFSKTATKVLTANLSFVGSVVTFLRQKIFRTKPVILNQNTPSITLGQQPRESVQDQSKDTTVYLRED